MNSSWKYFCLPFMCSSWLIELLLTPPPEIWFTERISNFTWLRCRWWDCRLTRHCTRIRICIAYKWASCWYTWWSLTWVEMRCWPSKKFNLTNSKFYFKLKFYLENPPCVPVWLWADGLNITGLLSDLFEPKLESDVVLELSPCHRPISEFRFRKIPDTSGAFGQYDVLFWPVALYCLYQSGILSFWSDACTRSWCSLKVTFDSRAFWSSFSGGYKTKNY